MSTEPNDAGDPPLRTIISDLRKPIHALDALKTLLQSALAELSISLVGSSKTKKGYQDSGAQFSASEVRYILPLQDVILQQIVPTWHHLLSEEDSDSLVDLLLNPPSENNRSAPLVAVQAHTSLLSALRTSTAFAVNLLERLTEDWPSEKLHFELFSNSLGLTDAQLDSIWSDYLRALFAIPAKVANATNNNVPDDLTFSEYFTRIVTGAERLLEQWARSNPNQPTSDSLAQLVLKLVNTGFFPPTSSPTQPSFFQTNYAAIQKQLRSKTSVQPDSNVSYTGIWSSILSSLPAPVVHKIATSLLGSMAWEGGLEYSPSVQRKISNNVRLLRGILGRLDANRTESWDLVSAVVIERPWPEQVAMALSQWAGGAELNESEKERSLGELLKRTLELWTSAQHVKFSLLSRHHYATALLLFTCALLPPASPALKALMSNQKFMSAIALYIGHTDPSIRHCGMLAAEWIAQRLGQKLKFDGWDEPGEGREWCRQLRKLLDDGFVVYSNSEEDEGNEETVEPEQVPSPPSDKQDPPTAPDQPTLYDSDDSLTGYAQDSPTSSRSASPTPSDLEEIEKEPGLAIGRRKIQKPVYLVQLARMLVSGKGEGQDEKSEPDRVEMALNEGLGLIRRKKGFGLELEENAVNLSIAFLNLKDNYDLDGFREKRQDVLNALVACCPTRSAPCIIEQFFIGEHSADVRSAILTALVTGARELAGLEEPPVPQRFASKMLPPALHRKYITPADVNPTPNSIHRIAEGITRQAIDRTRDANEVKVPQIMREKQLRVRQRPLGRTIVDLDDEQQQQQAPRSSTNRFTGLAAEYFIMPLINRFWIHVRDEQAREARTRYSRSSSSYRADGSGMILSPAVLSQLLLTLAILMHAARNSPAYLGVLVPEAVELAVTTGTQRAAAEVNEEGEGSGKANVLAAALELTLEALDGSWELDQGRTMGLDHTRTILAVREWAQKVFSALDKGLLIDEGGGKGEERARRASAGVLLVVEEIVAKWTAAMLRF